MAMRFNRHFYAIRAARNNLNREIAAARDDLRNQLDCWTEHSNHTPRDTPEAYLRHKEFKDACFELKMFFTHFATLSAHATVRRPAAYSIVLTRRGNTLARRLTPPGINYSAGRCPVCGEDTFIRNGSYGDATRYACSHCVAEGAVYGADQWWKNQAAMDLALTPTVVWLLEGDGLSRHKTFVQQLAHMRTVKTEDDVLVTRNGEPVYYHNRTLQFEYHRGPTPMAYDNAPIGVGIELEVNAGTHGRVEARENIIGRILLATGHSVKVERDGSVTGFEVISGYGSPAAVRERLAPVFANDLLKGFRTSSGTGAHVHVTNPWKGALPATNLDEVRNAVRPLTSIYEKLAGRTYNGHTRNGISANRYTSVALRGETVEFRLFKMQLSLAKLMRNAQFAWSAISQQNAVPDDADQVTTQDRWLQWVADQPRHQTLELRAWLAGEGYKVPHVQSEYRKFYRELGIGAITV